MDQPKTYYRDFWITKGSNGYWHYNHQYYTNAGGGAPTLAKAKQAVDDYHSDWDDDYYYLYEDDGDIY